MEYAELDTGSRLMEEHTTRAQSQEKREKYNLKSVVFRENMNNRILCDTESTAPYFMKMGSCQNLSTMNKLDKTL